MVLTAEKLLILDLDETLIYATEKPLSRPADFQVGPYLVYKRPHLTEFIADCLTWFRVGVWTSSSPLYAAEVVEAIFPEVRDLSFVWASDRCTWRTDLETCERVGSKNLKKIKQLGYRLETVLVVDDSPEKLRQSYGNLIQVKPYTGQEDDRELVLLGHYLGQLRGVENVRVIEKRRWRASVQGEHSTAHHEEGK